MENNLNTRNAVGGMMQKNPSRQHLLNWSLTFLMILAAFVCSSGFAADEVFTCPKPFIAGEVNTLTVQLSKKAIQDAQCWLPANVVTFNRRLVGGVPSSSTVTLCRASYSCLTTEPVRDPTPEKATCGCVDKSDDILRFEMKLFVNKSKDAGANYSYTVCVNPQNEPTKIVNNCDSVSVENAVSVKNAASSSSVASSSGVTPMPLVTTSLPNNQTPGFAADEVLTCPKPFIAGEVNTLTVQLSKKAIQDAQCLFPVNLILFHRNRVGDIFTSRTVTLCYASYSCLTTEPVRDPTPEEATCGCVYKSDDILRFEMKLFVDKNKDAGAKYSYTVCVIPQNKPTRIVNNCDSVSVENAVSVKNAAETTAEGKEETSSEPK